MDGIHEVWKSDGTESGTVFLKTVVNVLDRTERDGNFFIAYNGYVYFGAATEPYNEELFRTDGTPAGTELFLDLNPSDGSEPHGFYVLNNKLLFIAAAENDDNLYTSDGTVAGTQILMDNNGNPAAAGAATAVGVLTVYTGDRIFMPVTRTMEIKYGLQMVLHPARISWPTSHLTILPKEQPLAAMLLSNSKMKMIIVIPSMKPMAP